MTISPPIRVFAVVGAIAATALAAFLFLAGRSATEVEPVVPSTPSTRPAPSQTAPAPATTSPAKASATPSKPEAAKTTKSGFPVKVDRALRKSRVVVVAVYVPGSSVDRAVLAEARSGAREGRAAYVAISAKNERIMRQLVAKTGLLPQPAVLVVKRPGVVTATLSVTDAGTVAQAVATAR